MAYVPPHLIRKIEMARHHLRRVDLDLHEVSFREVAEQFSLTSCRATSAQTVEVAGKTEVRGEEIIPTVSVGRAGLWIALVAHCSCSTLHKGESCIHVDALIDEMITHLDGQDPRLSLLSNLIQGLNLEAWVEAGPVSDADVLERADRDAEILFREWATGPTLPAQATPAPVQRPVWLVVPQYGDVSVQLCIQRLGKRGDWLKPGRIEAHRLQEYRALLSAEDVALAHLAGFSDFRSKPLRHVMDWQLLRSRPVVFNDRQESIIWHEAPLELSVIRDGAAWTVVFPQFDDQGWLWTLELADGVAAMAQDRRTVSILSATTDALRMFQRRKRLRFAERTVQSEAFRTVVARASIALPSALEGETIVADSTAHLLLSWQGDQLLARVAFRPLPELPWQDPATGHPRMHTRQVVGEGSAQSSRWVVAVRDFDHETVQAAALATRVQLPPGIGWTRTLDLQPAAELLERLVELGVTPHWSGNATSTVKADEKQLRVKIQRTRDWLDVQAGVRVDQQTIALSELLSAARSQGRWVRIDGDRLLQLSDDLKRRLRQLSAAGDQAPTSAAPLLDLALDGLDDEQLDVDKAWLALRKKLHDAQAFQPILPKKLNAILRDYQLAGFAWMARLAEWGSGAVLADDMGLGKTVQTIAMLLHRAKLGPALVVCPTSVEGNWCDEIARFAPSLKVQLFREQRDFTKLKANHVLLVSYGLVQRQSDVFAAQIFATMVLDEAQQVKNADAKRTHALAAVNAGWRVALSGTPVENRLDELWSIMRLVIPGLLGGREYFARAFAEPIENQRDANKRDELRQRIAPFVLRRTKSQVATELPSRTDIVHRVELSPAERDLYEAERLRASNELAGHEKTGKDQRFAIFAALTRLRQLACAPGLLLDNHGARSAKLDELIVLATELRDNGHRALIFSQFTSLLDLAGQRLHEAGITTLRLDGTTPAPRRRELVKEFQTGVGDCFLISLKAGGTGLNLTAADYVIHLDPWWNPASEDQATDRAHRIGQMRPVTVYRLVATGTIEERIIELHREKRDLIDALLSDSDKAGKLSSRQLLELIKAV